MCICMYAVILSCGSWVYKGLSSIYSFLLLELKAHGARGANQNNAVRTLFLPSRMALHPVDVPPCDDIAASAERRAAKQRMGQGSDDTSGHDCTY